MRCRRCGSSLNTAFVCNVCKKDNQPKPESSAVPAQPESRSEQSLADRLRAESMEWAATGNSRTLSVNLALLLSEAASAVSEQTERAWKRGDPERRKDNWTLITQEYRSKYGFKYKASDGTVYSFFGLVEAEDDYYYGLVDTDGKVRLATCVGGLEMMYEQIPNGGRCGWCNEVFPVEGPQKCDRYRCPQGPTPLRDERKRSES